MQYHNIIFDRFCWSFFSTSCVYPDIIGCLQSQTTVM